MPNSPSDIGMFKCQPGNNRSAVMQNTLRLNALPGPRASRNKIYE